MDQNRIQLIVEGKDAAVAAKEIQQIFKNALNSDIDLHPIQSAAPTDTVKAVDPVSVAMAAAGLLIAIPSSALAAMKITDRLKKKKQLDQAVEQTQKKVLTTHEVTIKLQFPDGTVQQIQTVDTTEIIDACRPQNEE